MFVFDFVYGMNFVSVVMVGFKVIEIFLNENGMVDFEVFENVVSERMVGLMLMNLNILGIFEDEIFEIVKIVYKVGGLFYYDGVNFNVVFGKIRLGDMGFDVVYFNFYKIFLIFYGGGGLGSGFVGVKDFFKDYFFVLFVSYDVENDCYYFDYNVLRSIGKVKEFYGNFVVIVRVLIYFKIMGREGFKEVSEVVVFNVNYFI